MVVLEHVRDPDRATVCVREVQQSLSQSVKRLIESKIRSLGVADYFEIRRDEIRSSRGHGIILFRGMSDQTAESIKSLEGFDCVWVEEAQSISQRSLDLLRPTIRKPDSELWFTWNPQRDTDPVDVLLRGPEVLPDAIVVKVNYGRNPWFPETLRQEIEFDRKHDRDKYLHVWEGEYLKHSEARVFKRWRVQDFRTPKDAQFRLGADFGYGGPDPTVIIRCFIEGKRLYVDYEAYKIGCEIDDTPELILSIPQAELWPIVADSARPDRIANLASKGFKIVGAIKGKGSVEAGIDWLKNYEIIVHPRCTHTIDELTHYSYQIDKITDQILPVLEDKHNHVIDALRYACENVRRLEARKPINAKVIPIMSRWNSRAA